MIKILHESGYFSISEPISIGGQKGGVLRCTNTCPSCNSSLTFYITLQDFLTLTHKVYGHILEAIDHLQSKESNRKIHQ